MPINRLVTQASAQRVLADKNFASATHLRAAAQRVKSHFLAKDRDLLTPPGAPADGDIYLLPAAGALVGDWAAFALNDIVVWDGGLPTPAWVKAGPNGEGDTVDVADEDLTLRWGGAEWQPGANGGVADLAALGALSGYTASRDRERVYVKTLSTEYEYRDDLDDATDDLIVVPAAGGGTKKWGLPTYLKAQGIDLGDIGVDLSGVVDSSAALAKAVAAAKVRGGLIKIPRGRLRLASASTIDIQGVVLEGIGSQDREPSFPNSSLIEIRQSSVSPFKCGENTRIEGVAFDYPDQVNSATPTPYPFLFDGEIWRDGGMTNCVVARAWNMADLGGMLQFRVTGKTWFTENHIYCLNRVLRIRAAPNTIRLIDNQISMDALFDFNFPLLGQFARGNAVCVEIADRNSAAWPSVDGFFVSDDNFIFGFRTAYLISTGELHISKIGGYIDQVQRALVVEPGGRIVNSEFQGFVWADNAEVNIISGPEAFLFNSHLDTSNSCVIRNTNILKAGGSCIAVLQPPDLAAIPNHSTEITISDSDFKNWGTDDLSVSRQGVFSNHAKATVNIRGSRFRAIDGETSQMGVFADKGVIDIKGSSFENITYPIWARGTAVINVGADVSVTNTKVNANNPSGKAYFSNETGAVNFKTHLGAASKIYDVTQFGAVADGLQSSAARNVAAFDAAVAAAAQNGGGTVFWPASPLVYYITNTRADTGNTFDQVCCAIEVNDVWVRGDPAGGTKIRIIDNGNANMFRIGGRLSRLGVQRSGVSHLNLDGNRANQIAVQALTHHFSGVELCVDGAVDCGIEDVYTKQMQYYGGGGEYGSNGSQNCWVEDFHAEDCGADGFDWKDNGSNGFGNSINGMWIKRFGLDGGALTDQSGLDKRTGVNSSRVFITEYGTAQGLNGIRIQRGARSNFTQRQASSVDNFYCRPSTKVGTRGVRVSQINAGLSNGEVFEAGTAYLISQRQLKATNCWAYACDDGWQLQDGIAGETNANNAMLSNCGSQGHTDEGLRLTGTIIGCEFHAFHSTSGAKGITIDAGVTNSRFFGGRVTANTTYNLQDSTPFGASNIFSMVEGIGGNLIAPSAGTFTPTVTFGTVGDFVPTYILQQARYMAIGPDLTIFGTVEFTANAYTTAAGEFRIGGLPFIASTALARYAGSASRLDNVDWPAGTPWQQVNAEITQSTSYMRLRASRDAAAGFVADVTAFPASGTYRIDFNVTYTRV